MARNKISCVHGGCGYRDGCALVGWCRDGPRGRCPACGAQRSLDSDGYLAFHEAATTDAEGVHDECPGTGQRPAPSCLACRKPVTWISCPTGGWWAHDEHPADGHDAQCDQRDGDWDEICRCAAICTCGDPDDFGYREPDFDHFGVH